MLKIKQFFLPQHLNDTQIFSYTGPITDPLYTLAENRVYTVEEYATLGDFQSFLSLQYNSDGTPYYMVTNGVKQITMNGNTVYYSPNLIPADFCYKLSIHSLPGNCFMINDNSSNIVRIGASGSFDMDFGDNPISSIRVLENNNYSTYETTIELMYLTADKEAI